MTRRVVLYIDSLKTGGAGTSPFSARWPEDGWLATVTRRGLGLIRCKVQQTVEPSDPSGCVCSDPGVSCPRHRLRGGCGVTNRIWSLA